MKIVKTSDKISDSVPDPQLHPFSHPLPIFLCFSFIFKIIDPFCSIHATRARSYRFGSHSPSRSSIEWQDWMNVGRAERGHPRATITCNTVGLSGPMGTRWGVLSAEKRILLQPRSALPHCPEGRDLSSLSYRSFSWLMTHQPPSSVRVLVNLLWALCAWIGDTPRLYSHNRGYNMHRLFSKWCKFIFFKNEISRDLCFIQCELFIYN